MVIAVEGEEQDTLESQLTATTTQHVNSVKETINALTTSHETLTKTSSNLSQLSHLIQKTTSIMENFPTIQLTSRIYSNFSETMRMWKQFEELDARINRTADLIEHDRKAMGDGRRPENVMLVFYYLKELGKFEAETMSLVGRPLTMGIRSPVSSAPSSAPASPASQTPLNVQTGGSTHVFISFRPECEHSYSAVEAVFSQTRRIKRFV